MKSLAGLTPSIAYGKGVASSGQQFCWGYESNDRSILVALLFHTASSLSFNLYNVVDRSPQRDERGLISWTLLMGLVAIVVASSARCYRRVPAPMPANA